MAKVKWLQFNFIKFEGGRHFKLAEWKNNKGWKHYKYRKCFGDVWLKSSSKITWNVKRKWILSPCVTGMSFVVSPLVTDLAQRWSP